MRPARKLSSSSRFVSSRSAPFPWRSDAETGFEAALAAFASGARDFYATSMEKGMDFAAAFYVFPPITGGLDS